MDRRMDARAKRRDFRASPPTTASSPSASPRPPPPAPAFLSLLSLMSLRSPRAGPPNAWVVVPCGSSSSSSFFAACFLTLTVSTGCITVVGARSRRAPRRTPPTDSAPVVYPRPLYGGGVFPGTPPGFVFARAVAFVARRRRSTRRSSSPRERKDNDSAATRAASAASSARSSNMVSALSSCRRMSRSPVRTSVAFRVAASRSSFRISTRRESGRRAGRRARGGAEAGERVACGSAARPSNTHAHAPTIRTTNGFDPYSDARASGGGASREAAVAFRAAAAPRADVSSVTWSCGASAGGARRGCPGGDGGRERGAASADARGIRDDGGWSGRAMAACGGREGDARGSAASPTTDHDASRGNASRRGTSPRRAWERPAGRGRDANAMDDAAAGSARLIRARGCEARGERRRDGAGHPPPRRM